MQQEKEFTFQRVIQVEFLGRFPPDTRALAGLGFESVAVSKSQITIRKSQPGVHSFPIAHIQITIKRNSAMLRARAPYGADARLQELRASAMFLSVLSLFPSMRVNASEIAKLLLPSLDAASSIAGMPYETLAKKYRDAQCDLSALLDRNQQLLRSSEESILASLELERQSTALSARIKKLEGVSDETLIELVQDYLSSHRGKFNAVLFSKAHNIPPARAEEGLERLLASGEVKKVGRSFYSQEAHSHGTFETGKASALSFIKGLFPISKRGN
jgi:hypothetical protein